MTYWWCFSLPSSGRYIPNCSSDVVGGMEPSAGAFSFETMTTVIVLSLALGLGSTIKAHEAAAHGQTAFLPVR